MVTDRDRYYGLINKGAGRKIFRLEYSAAIWADDPAIVGDQTH